MGRTSFNAKTSDAGQLSIGECNFLGIKKNVRTKNQQKYILLKMENMSVEIVLNTSNISQISKDTSKLVARPRSLPKNAHYAPKQLSFNVI